jgi:uncharacterized protein (DUF952 family)
MPETKIYHVCKREEWQVAEARGAYAGSSQDAIDGFIHFSDLSQVRASTAKHRAGQDNLTLLVVEASQLGDALKWEPSRNDMLFPHLYSELPVKAVIETIDINLDEDGSHIFPDGYPI